MPGLACVNSGNGCCRTWCLVLGIEKSNALDTLVLSEHNIAFENFLDSLFADPDLVRLDERVEEKRFRRRLLFLLNLRQSSFINLHNTPTTSVVMVTTNAIYPIKGLIIPGSFVSWWMVIEAKRRLIKTAVYTNASQAR
jgi:hypothetical protein